MTRLNGETLQQGEVSDLIFPIAELIAYISAFTPVAGRRDRHRHAGGRGSSRKPPRFMAAGDALEVDIPGVGTLVNRVTDEPAPAHQEQGDAHG